MAKYLVVARDGDKNVTAHFYQQLLDGIVASDMLFGQDGAAIVENHSPVVTQDRASLVLEMHGIDKHVFVFRVPSQATCQMIFQTGYGLDFIETKKTKQKPDSTSPLLIKTVGAYTLISF